MSFGLRFSGCVVVIISGLFCGILVGLLSLRFVVCLLVVWCSLKGWVS